MRSRNSGKEKIDPADVAVVFVRGGWGDKILKGDDE